MKPENVHCFLDDREQSVIETSHHENASLPETSKDSESEFPDLQSSSSSERGTNLPPPSGKFWDNSDSESPKTANKNGDSSDYWNDPTASYDSPQQQYSTLCPRLSPPRLLQLFIEHESPKRADITVSEMLTWLGLLDDFEISSARIMDESLRKPVAQLLSALLNEYNTSLHTSFCEFLHHHLRCHLKLEISARKAIVRECVNSPSQLLESLEHQIRNDIHHTHKLKAYKLFWPAHLNTNRLVMAHIIKLNCKEKPFRTAWLQTSNKNGGNVDPFHDSDITLQNFLRMQGLLKGPAISHFPAKTPTKNWSASAMVKLPSKSWFELVEDEQSVNDHLETMAAVLLQSADIFSSPSALSISSAFSAISPTVPDLPTDLHLGFDLALYTSAMVENASRLPIQTQLLKERAQLTGSASAIHCTSHLLHQNELFLESCKLLWSSVNETPSFSG